MSTKLNGDSDKAATEKKEADEKKEGTGSILGNIGLKMDQYAKQVYLAYYGTCQVVMNFISYKKTCFIYGSWVIIVLFCFCFDYGFPWP